MVLENRSFEQVIGSNRAPYINRLARRYALATGYYAVTHPSLPNYIALTGGSVAEFKRNFAACDTPGSYTQMLWTGVRKKAAYPPGC